MHAATRERNRRGSGDAARSDLPCARAASLEIWVSRCGFAGFCERNATATGLWREPAGKVGLGGRAGTFGANPSKNFFFIRSEKNLLFGLYKGAPTVATAMFKSPSAVALVLLFGL